MLITTNDRALENLNVEPEFLLVDGHRFDPYFNQNGELVEHKCFVGGDDLYTAYFRKVF